MSRTNSHRILRRLVQLATLSPDSASPSPLDALEKTKSRVITRRRFMQTAGGLLISAAAGNCRSTRGMRVRRSGARVVIVGGGLAGLTAAHRLQRAGIQFEIYDSNSRV